MISHIESFILRMDGIDDYAISNYFKNIRYRGLYFVELKAQCIELLRKKGYSVTKIRDLVGLTNHATVVHHLHSRKKDKRLYEEVKKNMDEWLTLRMYPINTNNGYKLVPRSEFKNIYIC